MTARDGGLMHTILIRGACALELAGEVDHQEALSLAMRLENGFINGLDAFDRALYYGGCDNRLDAVLKGTAPKVELDEAEARL